MLSQQQYDAMKTVYNIIITSAAMIAVAGAQAPEKPKPDRKGPPGPPPEIVARFDKDGDGQLSPEEAEAARAAMRSEKEKEMLKRFDKDGDGVLSKEEKEAARKEFGDRGDRKRLPEKDKAEMEERRKKMLERFDKNGDGELDEQERKAAREEWGPRPGGPRRPDNRVPRAED
jgi:hypothetical protein